MLQRLWFQLRWYLEQMVQQFLDHDCMARAGALTYTTLFAFVPMMTVGYFMVSVMPEFSGVGGQIESFVFNNFLPDSSAIVQEKLLEFSERARNLTVAGFVFLYVTAFLMLVTLEKAFNVIWQVAEPRRGLSRFLVYWGVLTLGPALVFGTIGISAYLVSMPLLTDFETYGVGTVLLGYLPQLFTVALFTVLYYAVPNCHVPFKHAALGGSLTMLMVELAKEVFAASVSNSSIEPVYGTFAAVPLFLIWLYFLWVIVLGGAIFVRTLSFERDLEGEQREPMLVKCSRILQLLYDAHLEGRSISDVEINKRVHLNRTEHDRVFSVLQELKLLNQTEDERWLLGRSLKAVTLWDLYQRLPEGLSGDRLAAVKDMDNVVEPLRSLVQFGSNQMSISLEVVFGGAV